MASACRDTRYAHSGDGLRARSSNPLAAMAAAEVSFCGPHGGAACQVGVEVPIRNLVGGQVTEPVAGVPLGDLEKLVLAGQRRRPC